MTDGDGKPQPKGFSLPGPIRRVFDKFPLVTLSANVLPQRSPKPTREHVLYLFRHGSELLSCNPSCLKWQAFLTFKDYKFKTQAANNHASPTGSLPFVIPRERPSSPVAATKIAKWVGVTEEQVRNEEAYIELIDYNLRNAWLYHLYLDQANFGSIAWSMYVSSASTNWFVRKSIARQLQTAAKEELLKNNHIIDGQELYDAGDKAFTALDILLGQNDYFFGAEKPGLFDASLFAYTHILLAVAWKTTTMADMLRTHKNLVSHQNRLVAQYFSADSTE